MTNITIESTGKTPSIKVDFENSILEIKGRSLPDNSVVFYEPVLKAIEQLLSNDKRQITVIVKLEWFNTPSSKSFLDIFKRIEKFYDRGNNSVKVEWYYPEDDEDMLEAGEDYSAIINIPFEFIKYKSE